MLTGVSLLTLPVRAHHSFAAEFDAKQPVMLKGIVTKVEWTNPHTYFYVDVKGASGVVNWAFETAGPNTLARQGWSRQSLKVGDEVTVVGYRARDGLPIASAREIVMSDGRKVLVGTPVDGGPQR
jgi:hypothetical protein